MSFYAVLTTVGLNKIAAALAGGPSVDIAEIALGDVATVPDPALTALGNEVWRGSINSCDPVPGMPNRVRIEVIVPPADGGWTMREAGAFDADGDLILIARIPDSYKPDPALDGASKTEYVRLVAELTNIAEAFALSVDSTAVMATRQHVEEASVGSLIFAWSHFS